MTLGQPAEAADRNAAIGDFARMKIRDELAEAIPGLVERDWFMQRIAELVARHTDQSLVAVYTRGVPGGDFVVRGSTLPPSSPPPVRMSAETDRRESVVWTVSGSGNAALVAPLRDGERLFGALVVFHPHGGFSGRDQAAVETLAREIAPVVSVAERFHAVKQNSVIEAASGAYTAWFLNQRLEEEIARARRQGRSVTLVLLRLDGIELSWSDLDFLGGSSIQRDLANALTSSTRLSDVVAQRGPGEFAVLLLDAEPGDADTIVERLRLRVARVLERTLLDPEVVSVALSHASFPFDGDDATGLVLSAEHRLDDALRRGTLIPAR